jgi:hypothetical protein
MKFDQQIIIKRWKPILEEYEKIKNKVLLRSLSFSQSSRSCSSYLKIKS